MSELTPFIDQIKQVLPLSRSVGKVVKLLRRGHEYTGVCPFHHEKTPSFTVNDQKGFYYCFGCGAHGDIVEFTMSYQRLDFLEAVKFLSDEAGLIMPKQTVQESQKQDAQKKLLRLMELTTRWYQHQLANHPKIMAYLNNRGLNQETIQKMRLGFAPDNGLKDFLLGKGYTSFDMQQAGLLILPEDNRSPYERFRQRVIFPIGNGRGHIIAFGGRVLDDSLPKYLNSPDTPLFLKGQTLYGYHQALGAKDQSPLVVVEGYMDAISLYQAGFTKVVAPLGTALTEDQLQLLWRLEKSPIICFDGDGAGEKAASRAARRALPLLKPGNSLQFCFLEKGEDPDSLVKKHGRLGMERVIEKSKPLSLFLWEEAYSIYTKNPTPESMAALKEDLFHLADQVLHPDIKNNYKNFFYKELTQLQRPLNNAIGYKKKSSKAAVSLSSRDMRQDMEKILLVTLINHPILISEVIEEFAQVSFSVKYQELQSFLMSYALENCETVPLAILFEKEDLGQLTKELLSKDVYFVAPFAHPKTEIEKARQGWHETKQSYDRMCQEEVISSFSSESGKEWQMLKQEKSRFLKNTKTRN